MHSNMRGRRASRKSNSSDSLEIHNENSTLTQRKYNMQYPEMDMSDTEQKGKRKRCFSKNAVMARMNRLRKKKYLENLQSNFAAVSEENVKLKDMVNRQSKLVKALKNEVLYLRNVVANSKELGMLLKSVSNNTGLPARSSLLKAKPEPEPERHPEEESDTKFNADFSLDNFPLDTRSSSRASDSDLQSEDTNFDDLFPVNSDLLPIEDDVILSSSMPNDNVLDLALLTSDNADSELMENNSTGDIMDMNYSTLLNGPTTFNGSSSLSSSHMLNGSSLSSPQMLNGTTALNDPLVVNGVTPTKAITDDAELYQDVGVCLHVAKQKVSLEFCARCNKNANRAWGVGVAGMSQ